jgi:hypothetical protein
MSTLGEPFGQVSSFACQPEGRRMSDCQNEPVDLLLETNGGITDVASAFLWALVAHGYLRSRCTGLELTPRTLHFSLNTQLNSPDRWGVRGAVEKARQGASGGVHGRIRPRIGRPARRTAPCARARPRIAGR